MRRESFNKFNPTELISQLLMVLSMRIQEATEAEDSARAENLEVLRDRISDLARELQDALSPTRKSRRASWPKIRRQVMSLGE